LICIWYTESVVPVHVVCHLTAPESTTINVTCDTDRLEIVRLYSVLSESTTILGIITIQSDFILLFCQAGLTALIRAVRSGDTETVEILVKAGANVNLQEKVSECN